MGSHMTWPFQVADHHCRITWAYNKILYFLDCDRLTGMVIGFVSDEQITASASTPKIYPGRARINETYGILTAVLY